ncbi:MAG: hypothetical protein BGO70_14415 [Bacteroidetes bacterium 43-93]|nr:universal stress protein [Bacteroidota bacterium]OJW96990.1 MAG: hypothetical protein BGO70_14415 [Bacteroidetes bacterium 43-93]
MKVLIAVDYSQQTERVLEAAKVLIGARVPQPDVTVVYIIDEMWLSTATGGEGEVFNTLRDDSKKINELAIKHLGNNVVYLEEYGIPTVKINEVLDSTPHDLLVFGMKGRSALADVFMGSMASHLLHRVKTPMLVVP